MSDIPCGVATGVGSLPGGDSAEAVRLVFGELPDFPHLPELPNRGAGADLLGRGAALLVDLPVEIRAGKWQTTRRAGIDVRRAKDYLERDLDALTDHAGEYDGPVKISAAGPWTLASGIGRSIGGALLRDEGAVRELSASLAEGLAAHAAQVAARLPHARVIVQIDEPGLPAVLAGEVPTESGFSRYRSIEDEVARVRLAEIVDTVGRPVIIHCCADRVPVALIASASAAAVSLDMSLIDLESAHALDPLGEALESGVRLIAGAVPASGEAAAADAAHIIRTLWARLGLPPDGLRDRVTVSPACGLAGSSPEHARAALTAAREAAKRIAELGPVLSCDHPS